MAITFHEGLPGAGKSYEAVANRLLPAVKAGRAVYTNVRGINCEAIAKQTGKTLDEVQQLVTCVEWDQTPKLLEIAAKDSLVLIDELQDFWPAGQKITDKRTIEWVTQHRHHGLDVVCMGQDLRDCNPLWRRRVDTKLVFSNARMFGRKGSYFWVAYAATSPEKFKKTQTGGGKYKGDVFECYQSRRPETTADGMDSDSRINVLGGFGLRYFLPVMVLLGIVGSVYAWRVFHDPSRIVHVQDKKPIAKVGVEPVGSSSAPSSIPATAKHINADSKSDDKDYVSRLFDQYRPRLGGVAEGMVDGKYRLIGRVEVLDDSFHVKERFSLSQLSELGWNFQMMENGLKVWKEKTVYIVTAWPIDPFGSVSQKSNAVVAAGGVSG